MNCYAFLQIVMDVYATQFELHVHVSTTIIKELTYTILKKKKKKQKDNYEINVILRFSEKKQG